MSELQSELPINIDNEPIWVAHQSLERYNDSAFKSKCPVCKEGILMVQREQKPPFKLIPFDYCILCGQQFLYTDVRMGCIVNNGKIILT